MKFISRTLNQIKSPIDAAYIIREQYKGQLPLLDLTQGVTNYPTAPIIADHVAKIACEPDGGKYTNRPGLEKLRKLVADEISQAYSGIVISDQVLITAGCNQAFCLTVSSLADSGDEIIIPVPYYFNHNMWLQLDRIKPIYLPTAPVFIPDAKKAEELITNKTRAIILITPGNPTGITIPPKVIREFADIAKRHNIMLILDETYRIFRTSEDPAHNLFSIPNWEDSIVSLHSFSKEFAIPGYRVGAVIAHQDLISEMMKLFDCMAICAPRLGQEAVIAGLTYAKGWRKEKAREIYEKQIHLEVLFKDKPGGFELCSSGAFYGWIKHPANNESTDSIVRRLLFTHGILCLPGTIFTPNDDGYLRFSFANLSLAEIDDLICRLKDY